MLEISTLEVPTFQFLSQFRFDLGLTTKIGKAFDKTFGANGENWIKLTKHLPGFGQNTIAGWLQSINFVPVQNKNKELRRLFREIGVERAVGEKAKGSKVEASRRPGRAKRRNIGGRRAQSQPPPVATPQVPDIPLQGRRAPPNTGASPDAPPNTPAPEAHGYLASFGAMFGGGM